MNNKEKFESQVINWDQFDNLPAGNEVTIDPEADAFEQIAPPPPGVYTFKVDFAQDGAQVKYTDKGQLYYSARLELTLLSDDLELSGAKAYPTVTSLIGRGKNSSTMSTLLIKGGGKLSSNTLNDRQLMADFRKWVVSEPIIQAEVDWSVGYQEVDKSWVTKYNSWKQIPTMDKDGNKQFRFEFTRKDGSLVQTNAMLTVKTYFAKDQLVNQNHNGKSESVATKSINELPRRRVVVTDEDDNQEIEKLERQVASAGRRR